MFLQRELLRDQFDINLDELVITDNLRRTGTINIKVRIAGNAKNDVGDITLVNTICSEINEDLSILHKKQVFIFS